MILGLDISTSITGYTVMDTSGIVQDCSFIDFKKCETLFEKATLIKDRLKEVFNKFPIEKVFIESSLLSFSGGKSSASVIATLTKFNGIVSYIVERDFLKSPEFIMATSARKLCGIKIVKGVNGQKTKKAKEQVMDHVLITEKWFIPEYKKTGKLKDHCFDQVDSFIIAKAGFLKTPLKTGP